MVQDEDERVFPLRKQSVDDALDRSEFHGRHKSKDSLVVFPRQTGEFFFRHDVIRDAVFFEQVHQFGGPFTAQTSLDEHFVGVLPAMIASASGRMPNTVSIVFSSIVRGCFGYFGTKGKAWRRPGRPVGAKVRFFSGKTKQKAKGLSKFFANCPILAF